MSKQRLLGTVRFKNMALVLFWMFWKQIRSILVPELRWWSTPKRESSPVLNCSNTFVTGKHWAQQWSKPAQSWSHVSCAFIGGSIGDNPESEDKIRRRFYRLYSKGTKKKKKENKISEGLKKPRLHLLSEQFESSQWCRSHQGWMSSPPPPELHLFFFNAKVKSCM